MTEMIETGASPDPEDIDAVFDAQLLSFPTVSRNEAGVWNFFDVIPDVADVAHRQGEWLAHETLSLAAQARAMDSLAVHMVVGAAYDAMREQKEEGGDPHWVAWAFIDAILSSAVGTYRPWSRG